MATLHIDDINKMAKKQLITPGPGRYEKAQTFGKEGKKLSFHARTPYDHIALKRSRNYPGPGSYNMSNVLTDDLQHSKNTNSISQKMGKARDRFFTPLNRRQEPAGSNYSPKNNLGQEGIFKYSAKAVIGK